MTLPMPESRRPGSERVHRWRAGVLEALSGCSAPVSAQTLHAMLRHRGARIGLSTVYRELHALTVSRQVREDHVGAEAVYRVSGRDLLMCDECGRSQELARPVRHAGGFNGFFGARGPVTVHGRCAACEARAEAAYR